MFYSEQLQSPINSYNVKRLYGVNPDNDPARAAEIGILPLTEVPQGYGVSHYRRESNSTYTAVPHCVSLIEHQMVEVLREAQTTIEQLREALNVPEPQPAVPEEDTLQEPEAPADPY